MQVTYPTRIMPCRRACIKYRDATQGTKSSFLLLTPPHLLASYLSGRQARCGGSLIISIMTNKPMEYS